MTCVRVWGPHLSESDALRERDVELPSPSLFCFHLATDVPSPPSSRFLEFSLLSDTVGQLGIALLGLTARGGHQQNLTFIWKLLALLGEECCEMVWLPFSQGVPTLRNDLEQR